MRKNDPVRSVIPLVFFKTFNEMLVCFFFLAVMVIVPPNIASPAQGHNAADRWKYISFEVYTLHALN